MIPTIAIVLAAVLIVSSGVGLYRKYLDLETERRRLADWQAALAQEHERLRSAAAELELLQLDPHALAMYERVRKRLGLT